MPETTPLIKAALNLRVGAGFDVYLYLHLLCPHLLLQFSSKFYFLKKRAKIISFTTNNIIKKGQKLFKPFALFHLN